MALPRIRSLAVVAAAAVIVVLFAAACGGGDDKQIDEMNGRLQEMQTSLTNIQAATDRAQALAALETLSSLQFHQLDANVQMASEVPAGLKGTITRAREVVAAAAWPQYLMDKAGALLTKLQDYEAAIDGGDLSKIKGISAEAHLAWHQLDQLGYPYLAGEMGALPGQHDMSNMPGMASPTATSAATPAPGPTMAPTMAPMPSPTMAPTPSPTMGPM